MRRRVGFERHAPAGDRMVDGEGPGVQREEFMGIMRPPVFAVADNRMPQIGHMDTDLVLAARQQNDIKHTERRHLADHPVGRPGEQAFRGIRR